MYVFMIVYICVLLFICVLMVASILLQEDKSGGGLGILGGSSQSFFGASSGSILTKFTSILLVIFLLSGIIIAIIFSRFTSESTVTTDDISKTEFSGYESKKIIIDSKTDFIDRDKTSD